MGEITKCTGAFQDKECTCPKCGNKHELYGGKGYSTIECRGNKYGYYHVMRCNACGMISEFEEK